MKKAIAIKWANALGKYKQTKMQMKKGNAFCPLGVLCDLYGKEHDIEWKKETTPIEMSFDNTEEIQSPTCETFLGEDALLPKRVMTWAGMKSKEGGMTLPFIATALPTKVQSALPKTIVSIASLNDGKWISGFRTKPLTFKEMAKFIKTNYKEL